MIRLGHGLRHLAKKSSTSLLGGAPPFMPQFKSSQLLVRVCTKSSVNLPTTWSCSKADTAARIYINTNNTARSYTSTNSAQRIVPRSRLPVSGGGLKAQCGLVHGAFTPTFYTATHIPTRTYVRLPYNALSSHLRNIGMNAQVAPSIYFKNVNYLPGDLASIRAKHTSAKTHTIPKDSAEDTAPDVHSIKAHNATTHPASDTAGGQISDYGIKSTASSTDESVTTKDKDNGVNSTTADEVLDGKEELRNERDNELVETAEQFHQPLVMGKENPSYTIAATHADEEPSKGLQGEKPPTAEGVLKARAEAASDRVDSRVWPIATGTALMGIAIGVVLPVLPGLTRELGLNSTQFGMVISILGLTRLFCNIPLASIGNRMGRKSLLVAGPVLCSISMFMHGHSYSFEQLMFWRFVQGAGSAMMMMGAQLHLADISTNRNRARTMAPMSAAWSAGVSCGPALGGYLADSYGFQAPFMFVGMAIAVVALNNALRIKETSTVQRLETGMELAKQIGSDMRRTSTRWTVLMRDCRNTRAVLMLHSTFWATASGAQFTLLPLLATSQFDATPGSLGQLFASLAIVNVIMSQPSAYFSDTFGRKTSMVPGTMLVSAAIGLTPFAQSWEQLMGLVVMWGFGNSILGTAPTSFLVDITKDRDRSDALALMRSGGDLGLLVGATASGLIAHSYGVGTAMACNSVLLAATSVSFALASTEPKFHLKQAGKTHPSTRKPASTTPPATPVEDISVVTQTHSPTSMFPNASSVERRTQTKK